MLSHAGAWNIHTLTVCHGWQGREKHDEQMYTTCALFCADVPTSLSIPRHSLFSLGTCVYIRIYGRTLFMVESERILPPQSQKKRCRSGRVEISARFNVFHTWA